MKEKFEQSEMQQRQGKSGEATQHADEEEKREE